MTNQEIMRALRCCGEDRPCGECPVHEKEKTCIDELCRYAADLIDRLTAENAALREQVPQWISCKDKLPTNRLKRYLIAFRNSIGSVVYTARYFPSDGWTCDNWEVPQNLITHWMPLPGAPGEGGKHE